MDPLQLLSLVLGGVICLWLIFPKVVSLLLRYLFSCDVSLEQIGFFPLSVKQFSMSKGSLGISFDSLFVGKNNVESDTYFRVEIAGLSVAIISNKRPPPTPEVGENSTNRLDVGHAYERLISKLSGVLGWASYSMDCWKVTIGTVYRDENVKIELQVRFGNGTIFA